MGISEPRDLDRVRRGFTNWLQAWRPDAERTSVAPIDKPATGLSSETLFLEVDWHVGGRDEHASLVARLPPHGDGLFPTYDIVTQGQLQRIVAGAGLPAVAPLAVEADERWVGAPFLLMPRVAGRVVRADIPYLRSGWLADATAEEQARLHAEFIRLLSSLHRLDWHALGCERLLGIPGDRRLRAEVDQWRAYLAWAGDGSVPGVYERAAAWCDAHVPDPEPASSLLWGDAQLGNVLVGDDMAVTAMLDFEMASIGPAELDLGWFRVLHRMTVARCGGDLPGFPDEADALAVYERQLGRPVDDLLWYEVFAALRSGAVMVRAARLLARLGVDDSWLTMGNPTIDVLHELLHP